MKFLIRLFIAFTLLVPSWSHASVLKRNLELAVGAGVLTAIGGGVAKKMFENHLNNPSPSLPTNSKKEASINEVFESNPWLKANVMNILNMTNQSLDLPNTPSREKLEVHHFVPWGLPDANRAR